MPAGKAAIRPARVTGAGFTLLEVLLVLGLVGLITSSVIAGFRSLTKAELRHSTAKLAAGIRYLFDRASTTGKIHRMVFDFQNGKYWAEVSDDRFFLPRDRETDESRTKEGEAIAEEKRLEDEAKARQAAGESPTGSVMGPGATGGVDEALLDPSRYQPTEWKPKRARFEPITERVMKVVELKKVKLAGLFTPRYAKPIATGLGYLYFFPLGQTEPAVIHLSDDKGESFFSLLVHPLSGKVKIEAGYIAPRIDEQFDDEGNRVGGP